MFAKSVTSLVLNVERSNAFKYLQLINIEDRSFAFSVLKLDKFILVILLHSANIREKSVTELVSKLDTSMLDNELQRLNILCIVKTLLVFILFIFKVFAEAKFWNIEVMSVTFDVSKLEISNSPKFLQSANILDISTTFIVLNLPRLILVKLSQF